MIKLKILPVAICCFVTALWTEVHGMEDIDKEYNKHKQASKKFFAGPTNNSALREIIKELHSKLKDSEPLPVINLDDLSSRTRIKLFRELTAICENKNISLPFIFNNKKFYINLKQSLIQRGNGRLTNIEKHNDIYCVLNSYTPATQKKAANKLLSSRSNSNTPIPHPKYSEEGEKVDLEILNILLDFEVARRLQRITETEISQAKMNIETREAVLDMAKEQFYHNSNVYYHGEKCDFQGNEEQEKKKFLKNYVKTYENGEKQFQYFEELQLSIESNKEELTAEAPAGSNPTRDIKYGDIYDELPIAAGIVGMLKLSTQNNNTEELSIFFKADKSYRVFSYGDFNCFVGAATPNHREQALKKILQTRSHSQTLEEIHQEYLEIFGGSSESDGEDYNTIEE